MARPLHLVLLVLLTALIHGSSGADAFKAPSPAPIRQPPQQQQRRVKTLPPPPPASSSSSPQRRSPVMEPVGRRGGGAAGGVVDRKKQAEANQGAQRGDALLLRPAVAGALVLAVATTAFFVLFGDGVESAWAAGGAAGARASAIDAAAILQKAGKRAIGGGASGAAASLVQLVTLGWLRTSMNYQYKYGGTLGETIGKLYKEGGVARFYQGLSVAALQLPLSRFGDVAANAFVLALLDSLDATRDLPIPLKTALGSISAGLWRLFLMPLDAVKTTYQVQGSSKGFEQIKTRLQEEGIASLYAGAVAQALATAVGHWPYFLTFNYLSSRIPVPPEGQLLERLGRNAFLGLCSSTVSDCCSNSIRVLKTTKQTSETNISYREALRLIIEKDGVLGLLGRGLQTRLAVNALQGMVFAVCWKYLEEAGFFAFK